MRQDCPFLWIEFSVAFASDVGKCSDSVIVLAKLCRSSEVDTSNRYTELLRELDPHGSGLRVCVGIVLYLSAISGARKRKYAPIATEFFSASRPDATLTHLSRWTKQKLAIGMLVLGQCSQSSEYLG